MDVGFSASNVHSFSAISDLKSVQQGHRFSWLANLDPTKLKTQNLPLMRSVPGTGAPEEGAPWQLAQAAPIREVAKKKVGRPKGSKDGFTCVRSQNKHLTLQGQDLLPFKPKGGGRGRGRGRGGGEGEGGRPRSCMKRHLSTRFET